jgi:hypothetical protein
MVMLSVVCEKDTVRAHSNYKLPVVQMPHVTHAASAKQPARPSADCSNAVARQSSLQKMTRHQQRNPPPRAALGPTSVKAGRLAGSLCQHDSSNSTKSSGAPSGMGGRPSDNATCSRIAPHCQPLKATWPVRSSHNMIPKE